MKLMMSSDDREFRSEFESCRMPKERFDHRAHVRLAYTYLVEVDTDAAVTRMRSALQAFLRHNGIEMSKYHETMTQAWILAVRHFMASSPGCASADHFIERHPILLDSRIMMTHYSAETLFSDEARERFVEPNLEEIPRHEPSERHGRK